MIKKRPTQIVGSGPQFTLFSTLKEMDSSPHPRATHQNMIQTGTLKSKVGLFAWTMDFVTGGRYVELATGVKQNQQTYLPVILKKGHLQMSNH